MSPRRQELAKSKGVSQTNSSQDLREMGYKGMPTGTRLLVQAVDQELPIADATGNIAQNQQTVDENAVRIEGDRATVQRTFATDASPSANEYSAGVRLLRSYGYRAGALETELEGMRLTADQKAVLLQGNSTDAIQYARESATAFVAAPLDELRERSAIFSRQAGGTITRLVDGTNRSIEFQFDATATVLANGVGVGFEEARAKTGWNVYSGAINAAFNTDGVTSIRFNGLWRPTHEFFTSYFANSQSHQFQGMTPQERITARNAVTTRAGITAGTRWSPQHTRGTAVDIDRVNGAEVNNGASTANNRTITRRESTTIASFTGNLWDTGARSLLTPWRIYHGRQPTLFNANTAAAGDPFNHRNHIHYGR